MLPPGPMLFRFLWLLFMNVCDKLECLSVEGHSSLNWCLWVWPEALLGKPLALPTIRLGWKGLQGTNTLDYYKHLQITALQSFVTLGPGGRKWQLIYSVRKGLFPE
jgi:hypothetical protein